MSKSEQAVIGALLQDNTKIDEIRALLKPVDFVDPRNSVIIAVIYAMQVGIDPLTVADKLKNDTGILVYLTECMNQCYAIDNLSIYANNVKEESKKRKILASAQRLIANPDNLDLHKQELMEIENDNVEQYHNIENLFTESLIRLDEKVNCGIETGFRDIDKALCGLQPGNLIVIAARPSIGKTLLALHMARHIGITNQLPTLFFSLEMQRYELCNRLISFYSEINSEKFLTKKFTEEEWKLLMIAQEKFTGSKLFIYDKPAITLDDIRCQARKLKNSEGLKSIFIDYIGLMGDKGENEVIRYGIISRGLKAIAKDFDVPVIAISQLNRELEKRQDKRPILSDIRQSGEIEQDADVIMFLYNGAGYKDIHCPPNIAELNVAKHRNGALAHINLRYNFSICEFRNY